MKPLKPATFDVLNYLQKNEGKATLKEIADALGRTTQSINGSAMSLTKEGFKLAVRTKETVEDAEGNAKQVSGLMLTDMGLEFVQPEEVEAE